MSYEVLIRRRAAKELAEIPLRDYERVSVPSPTWARIHDCRAVSSSPDVLAGEFGSEIIESSMKLTIQTKPSRCWTLATDAISTTNVMALSCLLQ
jgi:hypothetical protein